MSRRAALMAISPVSSEQWGMITAGQARRLGVSRQDLKRLLDDGTLAVADGATRVYRLTGAPEDPELDPLRAAWLQLGAAKSWHERTAAHPDAVISHRSAAHLRGLGDLIPYEHEFYTTTRLRPRRTDIKVRVRSRMPPGSWEIWGGLPIRTVPAIIDDLLADGEDESAVAQVVQDALGLGLLRRPALSAIVAPHAAAYGRAESETFAQALAGEVADRPHYRVFPIADHLADKLCATIGAYTRDGQPAGSSRVKDLVDIAIIAITQTVDADVLRSAVIGNAAMREIELPERFTVPDGTGWATRYPRVAAEAPGPVSDFGTAVSLASQLFDPILNGTATGIWNPSSRNWTRVRRADSGRHDVGV